MSSKGQLRAAGDVLEGAVQGCQACPLWDS